MRAFVTKGAGKRGRTRWLCGYSPRAAHFGRDLPPHIRHQAHRAQSCCQDDWTPGHGHAAACTAEVHTGQVGASTEASRIVGSVCETQLLQMWLRSGAGTAAVTWAVWLGSHALKAVWLRVGRLRWRGAFTSGRRSQRRRRSSCDLHRRTAWRLGSICIARADSCRKQHEVLSWSFSWSLPPARAV